MRLTLPLLLVALLALPALATAFLAARPNVIITSRPAASPSRSRMAVSMQAAPSDEELAKVFGRIADKVRSNGLVGCATRAYRPMAHDPGSTPATDTPLNAQSPRPFYRPNPPTQAIFLDESAGQCCHSGCDNCEWRYDFDVMRAARPKWLVTYQVSYLLVFIYVSFFHSLRPRRLAPVNGRDTSGLKTNSCNRTQERKFDSDAHRAKWVR